MFQRYLIYSDKICNIPTRIDLISTYLSAFIKLIPPKKYDKISITHHTSHIVLYTCNYKARLTIIAAIFDLDKLDQKPVPQTTSGLSISKQRSSSGVARPAPAVANMTPQALTRETFV